ncbi:hypothetical protein F5148DRAFT_1012380 [Russula earlei]|uniref:Uncharacterized protein n=1 Tax=Russula earlei TaxID=71964 RepID=A0ACC0UCB1_9AGAM|nr:hypothetical protein F5148DRAFT_1012380 [Russula earlei]
MTPDSDQVVPDYPLEGDVRDPETGNAIVIPCNPTFDIPQSHMIPPSDIDRFASWLVYLPLQTAERAMHLVHPDSKGWSFVAQTGDIDGADFRCYAWAHPPTSTGGRETAAVVMVMPPWTLTPTDLQCFAACKEARTQFPLFGDAGRARLNDDQRMWGKASQPIPLLHDICVAKDSPYFVVTNYYGWVFGVFSKGWSVAVVGEVQAYGSQTPTVIEHLLFWLSSSMNKLGTYRRPEVGSEPVLPSEECPCLVYDVMTKNPRAALALYFLD